MRFTIIRSESMVVIDNAPLVLDCSTVPANVEVVAYEDTGGTVEYNDRPSVRVMFTDPSPYQPILNSWMTTSAAASPALQLAQAKTIKAGLVEGIFHHKRRLPYSAVGYSWDTNAESIASLETLVRGKASISLSSDTSVLVASINDAFSVLTNQINDKVVAENNISAGNVNGWSTTMAINWANLDLVYQQLNGTTGGASTGTQHTHTYFVYGYTLDVNYRSPGAGGFQSMTNLSGVTISGGVNMTSSLNYTGTIATQPLNSGSMVNVPASDVNVALQGIAARRETLNSNRLTKQAAINALTTIPAVVAYDATTGWSF
jgi:hypothetical protein